MQAKPKSSVGRSTRAAFTLVELIVIIAMLALGAMCLVPALARTKPNTRGFQCLNNHRQLVRAWRMYADDNGELLPGNNSGQSLPTYPVWAGGWLDWSIAVLNTNSIVLSDPRYSALAPYNGRDARPFKCPSDKFLSSVQLARGWKERVRSVAKNYGLGGSSSGIGLDPSYITVKKWTELVNPKPAETWMSLDEHPDSINDGDLVPPRAGQWVDIPANYHDGGAGVAYADGSAEVHHWEGSALNNPVRLGFTPLPTLPNDPDIAWLRYHTPRKPGAN